MTKTIDVGKNFSITVENVSHGIKLEVAERSSKLVWVLAPITASKLSEALADALKVRELEKRRPSPPRNANSRR